MNDKRVTPTDGRRHDDDRRKGPSTHYKGTERRAGNRRGGIGRRAGSAV